MMETGISWIVFLLIPEVPMNLVLYISTDFCTMIILFNHTFVGDSLIGLKRIKLQINCMLY